MINTIKATINLTNVCLDEVDLGNGVIYRGDDLATTLEIKAPINSNAYVLLACITPNGRNLGPFNADSTTSSSTATTYEFLLTKENGYNFAVGRTELIVYYCVVNTNSSISKKAIGSICVDVKKGVSVDDEATFIIGDTTDADAVLTDLNAKMDNLINQVATFSTQLSNKLDKSVTNGTEQTVLFNTGDAGGVTFNGNDKNVYIEVDNDGYEQQVIYGRNTTTFENKGDKIKITSTDGTNTNAIEISSNDATINGVTIADESQVDDVANDLAQEILDRQTAVSNEATARQNADNTLQTNIDNEALARGNADTLLQANIDASGHKIEVLKDLSTYQYTFVLYDANDNVLSSQLIDLPIESMIINVSYDATNKDLIITLQSGTTLTVPLDDIVSGLASQDWVTAQLSTKADASTTYTKSEVDTKLDAEKNYTDNIYTLATNNIAGKDTSANILAKSSNSGIWVGTDTGHWYYWNGTQYADGGEYLVNVLNDKNQVIYFYPQSIVYITETTNDKILFGYTSYMSMRGFSPNIYSKSLNDLATDVNKTIVLDSENRNCIELNTGEILVYDSVANTYAIKTTNNVLSTDYVILKCNQGVLSYACIGLLAKYFNNKLNLYVNDMSSNIVNIKKNVYFSENFKVIEKYTYNNSSDYIAFSFSSIRNRGFNNTHYNDSFNTIVGYLGITPEVIESISYILLNSNEVLVFNDNTNTYSIKSRNNININDYVIIGCNQGQITQCPIDMINQYLKNYCDKKVIDLTPNLELPNNWINKVNDIKSIQAKKFTMFLQTDTHFSLVDNNNTSDKYEYPMKVLSNYIYNDVNVNLGDIARGYTTNEPISVVENELTEVIQRYLKCSNTPLLLARGNHDNAILSTDGPISDDNLYAYLTKAIKKTTNITEGGNFYYYKDFDNIRIIVLDTEDTEIKGINNHAISTTQLNWFNNVALNTDKSLIIMSHCPLQQSLYLDTNYCVNMNEIVSSLENYSGDVIACLSGHTHQQADTTVNGINYIGFKNGGDYCNVLLVDLQNKTIDIKLIGDYGTLVDRTFNY